MASGGRVSIFSADVSDAAGVTISDESAIVRFPCLDYLLRGPIKVRTCGGQIGKPVVRAVRLRRYSSVLLSRVSHVSTSTPCASASFRNCATSASAMHFESNASNAASSARSLSPPIAARCLN